MKINPDAAVVVVGGGLVMAWLLAMFVFWTQLPFVVQIGFLLGSVEICVRFVHPHVWFRHGLAFVGWLVLGAYIKAQKFTNGVALVGALVVTVVVYAFILVITHPSLLRSLFGRVVVNKPRSRTVK